jgi:hypothetical protein
MNIDSRGNVADLWHRKVLYSLLKLLQSETITAKTYFTFQAPFSIVGKSPNGFLVRRKANPPETTYSCVCKHLSLLHVSVYMEET